MMSLGAEAAQRDYVLAKSSNQDMVHDAQHEEADTTTYPVL
jgi:hypothetical protein